jgi:hypothetical protein
MWGCRGEVAKRATAVMATKAGHGKRPRYRLPHTACIFSSRAPHKETDKTPSSRARADTRRPPRHLPHQILSHECRVQWIVGRALGHVRQQVHVRQQAHQRQQPLHQAWLERYGEVALWAASYRHRFVASTAQQVLGCVVTIVGGGDVRMVSRLLALIAALYARLLIPAFIHSRIYGRLRRALSLSLSLFLSRGS